MGNVEWCNERTILTPNPLIDFRLGIPQVKVRLGSCYCGMAPVDWRRATEVVALRDARSHHVRGPRPDECREGLPVAARLVAAVISHKIRQFRTSGGTE